MRRLTGSGALPVLACVLAVALSGAPAVAQHAAGRGVDDRHAGGAHQHFDGRYSHNQYYYDRGYATHGRPAGGVGELRGRDGGRYWFHGGGDWYRWRSGAWVVWGAPLGLFVPYLPWYYSTVWWYGIPYYYANDTYYVWDDIEHAYSVVQPPAGIESGGTTRLPASDQLFVYPSNGQSAAQQSQDGYECHRWAVDNSGYDPTKSGPGVAAPVNARNEYFRGKVACLEGRGYAVK